MKRFNSTGYIDFGLSSFALVNIFGSFRKLFKLIMFIFRSSPSPLLSLKHRAIQQEPLSVKRKVAADSGCHGDVLEDDIAPCLRKKSLSDLLSIKLDPPRWD